MHLTKKTALFIGLVGVGLFLLVAGTRGAPLMCDAHDIVCMKKYDSVALFFLIFLPVFLLSAITYFLREEIFRTWLHFTYFWLPIYIIAVYFIADNSSGGFGIPNVFDQQTVSFIFSGLFLIISLIIITVKSLTHSKEAK